MREATVQTFAVRSDAEIARARLEADGIPSIVAIDDEGGLNPGFYREYGVRLVVSEEDLDDAFASLGIERMVVPRPVAHAMAQHAVWAFPHEACGLVLFGDDRPVFVCSLTNRDASAHRFTIDPAEHHGAMRFADRNGWTVGGTFHSHPRSEPYPSDRDRSGGGDPDWVHFLIGPVVGSNGALRAFRYDGDLVTEVSVDVQP